MRTVKILNGDTRKKFKSIKEAEKFILDNKIQPTLGDDFIELESTTITNKKIKIDKSALKESYKTKIFDSLISRVENEIPYSSLDNSFMGNFLTEYLDKKYPIIKYGGKVKKHMFDSHYSTIKKELNLEDKHFLEVQNLMIERGKRGVTCPYLIWIDSDRFPNYREFDDLHLIRKVKTIDEEELHRKCVLNYLKDVKKNIKDHEIKYFYTKTNYIPCNALYGIEIGNIPFYVRSSQMCLYDTLIGRNVSIKGVYEITNEYFEKLKL